jgi:hypothetical protein
MKFETRMVFLFLICSFAGLSVLSQRTLHGPPPELSAKALIKCSQRSRGDLVCAPSMTVLTSDNYTKPNTVAVQVRINKLGKVSSAHAISGNRKWRRFVVADAKRRNLQPLRLSGELVEFVGVLVYQVEDR